MGWHGLLTYPRVGWTYISAANSAKERVFRLVNYERSFQPNRKDPSKKYKDLAVDPLERLAW